MKNKISNHQKNQQAQDILINKLRNLGAKEINTKILNRRKFIEFSINGETRTVYFNSKTKGTQWQLSLNHSENCDPNIKNNTFWILIDIPKNQFFVMPERWLARNIYDVHYSYIQNHGGHRPVNQESTHHSKSEHEIIIWKEAWHMIFEDQTTYLYGDEVQEKQSYTEGSVSSIRVNSYERNQEARQACLNSKGYTCKICKFNFEKVYGEIGKQFIHVHHIIELNSIGTSYSVNPETDLVPVCPNCHSMLHKRKPAYTINELETIISHNSIK